MDRIADTAIATDDAFRSEVENDVRDANISIIEGTGASQLGIGIVGERVLRRAAWAVLIVPWDASR